jgi:hypothetical protein
MSAPRRTTTPKDTEILVCYHCANTVPQRRVASYRGQQLYEHYNDERFNEDFAYDLYQCPTCQGISIYGGFVEYPKFETLSERRIYPRGSHLLPERHKIASAECVPQHIIKLYEKIWPLRHVAPDAFAAQVRRALEFICRDQNAKGDNLFQQLKDLVARGTFPGYFAEITNLMRNVGNLAAHAGEQDIDFWDAELLDDFFRSVVEYVYIAPSKIERLKQRTSSRKAPSREEPVDPPF